MSSLVVRSLGEIGSRELIAHSRVLLDVPLAGDAELWLGRANSEAVALGAFDRGVRLPAGRPLARRSSGGPPVALGPGTLWLALALERPSALVACDASRLVNRYVRPLLRALTRVDCNANYFGRDWIAVRHRPAAWVGFAHDASSGRSVVESFVAVRTPFATGPRSSFLGKEPATLESLSGREVDPLRLEEAAVKAYAEAYGREPLQAAASGEQPPLDHEGDLRADPPWCATIEEAIGEVGAGPDRLGVLRLGGELLASRDAVDRLAARARDLGEHATKEELERIARDVFGAPGLALDGVRSLASLADVLLRAVDPG